MSRVAKLSLQGQMVTDNESFDGRSRHVFGAGTVHNTQLMVTHLVTLGKALYGANIGSLFTVCRLNGFHVNITCLEETFQVGYPSCLVAPFCVIRATHLHTSSFHLTSLQFLVSVERARRR